MRIGLIGTGRWAQTVHAPSLARHGNVDFAGVWGRDPARTAEMSSRFGVRPYAQPEELIEAVDALAFAVPPAVQAEVARRAAERGRHLLLEKPIATSLIDARRLEEEVTRAGVASIVFFTHRFFPQTQSWLDRVRTAGGLYFGRVEIAFSALAALSESPWRREYGALWDLGPHALSLLVPLLGEVTTVVAERGGGDQVHVIMRHEPDNSSVASVTLTAPSATGTNVYVDGERGRETLPSTPLEPPNLIGAHMAAVDALLGVAAQSDRRHPCDVRFGARVVQVLDAAQRSLASSHRIELAHV
jgi:predicted dehydrogenase